MSRIEAPHDTVTGSLVDRLLTGLPAEAVLTDPDVTASYANDMASFCPAGTVSSSRRASIRLMITA